MTTNTETDSEYEIAIRENRLRRVAQRQGLTVIKSGGRDRRATEHVLFRLAEVVAPGGCWRSPVLLPSEHGITIDRVADDQNPDKSS